MNKQQPEQITKQFKGFLHDLGSPLTVLQYQLSKATTQLSEADRQSIAAILESATEGVEHLSRMIISTRKQLTDSPEVEMFSIIHAIQQVVDMYQPFAAGVGVSFDEQFNFDHLLIGDRALFQRIIGNLIQNAIEALVDSNSENMKIFLKTSKSVKDIVVEISDTGPGVPKALQEKIFNAGVSSKGYDRGTGLALVKDLIVRRFNGRIALCNTKSGATFLIRIPIA